MLVLDANILLRAVSGSRVLGLLQKYIEQIDFVAPDVAFEETREHLPALLDARGIAADHALATLELLAGLVQPVEEDTYSSF